MAKISEFLKKKQDEKVSAKAPEKEYGTGMVIALPDDFETPRGSSTPIMDKFISSIGQNPEGNCLVVKGKVVLSFDEKAPVGSDVEVKIAPERQTRAIVANLIKGEVEKGSHLVLEGARVTGDGKVEARWAKNGSPNKRPVVVGLATEAEVSWPGGPGTDGKPIKVAIGDLSDENSKDLESALNDPIRAENIKYDRTFYFPEKAIAVQTGDTDVLAKKVLDSGVSVGNTYILRLFSKEGQIVGSVQGFIGKVKDEKGAWVNQSMTDSLNKTMTFFYDKKKLSALSEAKDLTMEIIPGNKYSTIRPKKDPNNPGLKTPSQTTAVVADLLERFKKETFSEYIYATQTGFRSTIGTLSVTSSPSQEPWLYETFKGGHEYYKNRDMIRTPNFEGFTASNEAEQTAEQASSQEVEEEEEAAVGPGM